MQKREVKSHKEVNSALKALLPDMPDVTSVDIQIKATGVHFCWDSPEEDEPVEPEVEAVPAVEPPVVDEPPMEPVVSDPEPEEEPVE